MWTRTWATTTIGLMAVIGVIAIAAPAEAASTLHYKVTNTSAQLGLTGAQQQLGGPTALNPNGLMSACSSVGTKTPYLISGSKVTNLTSWSGWQWPNGGCATAINGKGVMAGVYNGPNGYTDGAFTAQNGVVTQIPALSGFIVQVTGINGTGQIIGQDGNDAYIYSGGKITLIPDTFGVITSAAATSATNQVVGTSCPASIDDYWPPCHGYLYRSGAMTEMAMPGYLASSAFDVNGANDVVGQLSTDESGSPASESAFEWTPAKGIVKLSSKLYAAIGINDKGWIVGAGVASGKQHAMLSRPGKSVVDLNTLIPKTSGWVLQEADSVNQKGQIIGVGTYKGAQTSFLLTVS